MILISVLAHELHGVVTVRVWGLLKSCEAVDEAQVDTAVLHSLLEKEGVFGVFVVEQVEEEGCQVCFGALLIGFNQFYNVDIAAVILKAAHDALELAALLVKRDGDWLHIFLQYLVSKN